MPPMLGRRAEAESVPTRRRLVSRCRHGTTDPDHVRCRRPTRTRGLLVSGARVRRAAAAARVRDVGGGADRIRDRSIRPRPGLRVVDPDGVGPPLFFPKVPEGKTAKNRVHLDVHVEPSELHAAPANSLRWAPPMSPSSTSPKVTGSRCSIRRATSSASTEDQADGGAGHRGRVGVERSCVDRDEPGGADRLPDLVNTPASSTGSPT